MTYVIVGNGVASIGAIEGIRKYDRKGRIVVVSEEKVSTYGRPLISYLLAGKVKKNCIGLRPRKFYKDNKVEEKLGVKVESVDTTARIIRLSDKETISYDKLLLATGGAPFAPQVEGIEGKGVYTFTTLEDAEELMGILPRIEKAVIVGAGLIALKAAEGLAAKGVAVTLVVRSRIMRVYFDETAGELLEKHLTEKGLTLKKATPEKIVRDAKGNIKAVATDKGEIETDLVIMAAGVRPRKELAEKAGIKTDKGILVDDHLRTSAKDVHAAGDCAEARDLFSSKPSVIPIWPNAYNQGFYAGINMAGVDQPYEGTLSMNSIAYFGLPTACTGMVDPPARGNYEVAFDLNRKDKVYRKLVFKDDRLVGYVFVGDIAGAGLYTGFIRFQVPVDDEIKADLKDGRASALQWPGEVFDRKFNPSLERPFGG